MIKRCIQLAYNGLGTTYPNPLVGCVIVHDGKIIGEGWHQKAGEPHAEVRAIASVKDKSLLAESTLYVSLEPCSHYGKTPPCADLIITHRIPRVVIGTTDPFAKVAGRGIEKLRAAGCEVTVGVMEKECRELNKRFFTFHAQKRPYIILKWAQTRDGFIAPLQQAQQTPVWISNAFSQQLTHLWRAQEGAILVGKHTVEKDNPSLTTRHWVGNNPLRLVIDNEHSLAKTLAIFQGDPTVVLTISPTLSMPKQVCNDLYERQIQSLIVEGGAHVLQQFIDDGLWDEARIFVGTPQFSAGLKAPQLSGNLITTQEIEGDYLFVVKNPAIEKRSL